MSRIITFRYNLSKQINERKDIHIKQRPDSDMENVLEKEKGSFSRNLVFCIWRLIENRKEAMAALLRQLMQCSHFVFHLQIGILLIWTKIKTFSLLLPSLQLPSGSYCLSTQIRIFRISTFFCFSCILFSRQNPTKEKKQETVLK